MFMYMRVTLFLFFSLNPYEKPKKWKHNMHGITVMVTCFGPFKN